MTPTIRMAADPAGAAAAAAKAVLDVVRAAIAEHGSATVALAGGGTPALLYRNLAMRGGGGARWDRVEFFFGDERCVPPRSPDSNFLLAKEALFTPLGIEPARVHRIEGEVEPPAEAAERYAGTLRRHFGVEVPRLDLVLLGMGVDGHTASLFPGSAALLEKSRWVVAVQAPSGIRPVDRVTLTLPLLNRANTVLFLVSGEAKQPAVAAVLGDGRADTQLPAARVSPQGRLLWFLDRAAAGRLCP
ncbi:MAG: 6-phosphogluconolactonase [Gemmatimonadetes bacterium]|nr:6-phosphogluconolactonase [Gemmatimonadota bacterium]